MPFVENAICPEVDQKQLAQAGSVSLSQLRPIQPNSTQFSLNCLSALSLTNPRQLLRDAQNWAVRLGSELADQRMSFGATAQHHQVCAHFFRNLI